jgi:peptidoglycan/xylan/chitin deacetylase (PgdA/CDA1 family)
VHRWARSSVVNLLRRQPHVGWSIAWVLVAFARLRSRPVGVIVLFHGVQETHDATLDALTPMLSADQLDSLLGWFDRRFAVVALDQLRTETGRRRRWARVPLAITLDDDLPSHATLVAPRLERAGMAATFFVGGDEAALRRAYWWEPLQLALDRNIPIPARGAITAAGRDPGRLATAMLAVTRAERAAITDELWARLGQVKRTRHLTREHTIALARAGHAIGFHTTEHDPLPTLDDLELSRALTVGRAELACVSARPVDVIAYPHGLADERVAAAALAAGFSLGLTTEPRAITPDSDSMRMGRVDVSVGPAAVLALRVARTLLRG